VSDAADWPVVVTGRCVDACIEAFEISGRDEAREWLNALIDKHGTITDRLPPTVCGRRSPSGYFVLVEDTLILPLKLDRDRNHQWIATNCIAFPPVREAARRHDLTRLAGSQLLQQVTFLPHAIERFHQRGGGHPSPERAHRELLATLTPTVRAARRAPPWCRTRPAEFYLIAGEHDQFCLPCRPSGGARPFDVITCIHRATHLFELGPTRLVTSCRLDPSHISAGGRAQRLLNNEFRLHAHLSWHRPTWARPRPDATWWIVFHHRVAAPVMWQPEHNDTPLLILDLADHRSFLIRLIDRIRHP
jgi:hypothetical protein